MEVYFDYVDCCIDVTYDTLMKCCGGTNTLVGDSIVSRLYLGNPTERKYLSDKLGINLPDADYYKLVVVNG